MTVATNDLGRVFIFPRGVNICNQRPIYGDCFGVDGLTQDNGDVTRIECPDPNQYGRFKEVGVFRGERGRLTTTMTRRMLLKQLLVLRGLFDTDCSVDIHIHWGQCTDPTAFNQYIVAWALQDVLVTSWGTDTGIAIQSSDRAPVNETIDISAGEFFEILAKLNYSRRAPLVTTLPMIDITICDSKACQGDACPPSTGCDKFYAIGEDANLKVSVDGGATWINVATPVGLTGAKVALACVGDYVVVITVTGNMAAISRNDADRGIIAGWRLFAIAIVPGTDGAPTTMHTVQTGSGQVALIGTATGRIFSLDTNLNLTLVDSTTAGGSSLSDFGSNGEVVVAVGPAGLVLYNSTGLWSQVLTAPTAADLLSALVKTDKVWLVGAADGELWCTTDGGCTWNRIRFPNDTVADTDVTDLCASNRHVLWMVAGGVLYRSVDGGSTWVTEPNDSTPGCQAAVEALGVVHTIACCAYDPNRVIAVGTAADETTGLIMLGEA